MAPEARWCDPGLDEEGRRRRISGLTSVVFNLRAAQRRAYALAWDALRHRAPRGPERVPPLHLSGLAFALPERRSESAEPSEPSVSDVSASSAGAYARRRAKGGGKGRLGTFGYATDRSRASAVASRDGFFASVDARIASLRAPMDGASTSSPRERRSASQASDAVSAASSLRSSASRTDWAGSVVQLGVPNSPPLEPPGAFHGVPGVPAAVVAAMSSAGARVERPREVPRAMDPVPEEPAPVPTRQVVQVPRTIDSVTEEPAFMPTRLVVEVPRTMDSVAEEPALAPTRVVVEVAATPAVPALQLPALSPPRTASPSSGSLSGSLSVSPSLSPELPERLWTAREESQPAARASEPTPRELAAPAPPAAWRSPALELEPCSSECSPGPPRPRRPLGEITNLRAAAVVPPATSPLFSQAGVKQPSPPQVSKGSGAARERTGPQERTQSVIARFLQQTAPPACPALDALRPLAGDAKVSSGGALGGWSPEVPGLQWPLASPGDSARPT